MSEQPRKAAPSLPEVATSPGVPIKAHAEGEGDEGSRREPPKQSGEVDGTSDDPVSANTKEEEETPHSTGGAGTSPNNLGSDST